MITKILELSKKLIEIPSTADNHKLLHKILKTAISELPGFDYTEFESNQTPSALFGNRGRDLKKYKIILNAHLDVVPGEKSQFIPTEKDGKLFGRGAYDMKAAAAVMILLFKEIARQVDYPLALQITTDEEIGGENGTGYQVDQGIRADFAITGEGTKFRIINEAKTRMILKLIAIGKASHSAYPWLGENAILKMANSIRRLYEFYPLPSSEWDGTTLNIVDIKTNDQSLSKTPAYCEALFNVRVIPAEKDTLLEKLRNIIADEVTLEVVQDSPVHLTDPGNLYIKKLKRIAKKITGSETELGRANGSSDACFFTSVKCDAIEFGPTGGSHHADNEWVDIQSLIDYYTILKTFLLT